MSRIDLRARQFVDLVKPVLPHVAPADNPPPLRSVNLEVSGDHLYAIATDRFSLACQRVVLDEPPGAPFAAALHVDDVRRVTTRFRPTRRFDPPMTLTLDGDGLVVQAAGVMDSEDARLTCRTIEQEGRLLTQLRRFLRESQTATPVNTIQALDPCILARFAAAQRHSESMIMWGTGLDKPVAVRVGEDFIAAVMPARGEITVEPLDETWTTLLAAPETDEAAA